MNIDNNIYAHTHSSYYAWYRVQRWEGTRTYKWYAAIEPLWGAIFVHFLYSFGKLLRQTHNFGQ